MSYERAIQNPYPCLVLMERAARKHNAIQFLELTNILVGSLGATLIGDQRIIDEIRKNLESRINSR